MYKGGVDEREWKMAEEAVKQKLNRIKRAIKIHLRNADYEIIPSDNEAICIIGARDTEWRCIKGYFKKIPYKEVIKLEHLPCPDNKTIKKELWLREEGETVFYKIFWNQEKHVWVDQFGKIIKFQ